MNKIFSSIYDLEIIEDYYQFPKYDASSKLKISSRLDRANSSRANSSKLKSDRYSLGHAGLG